jgi:hypothetical protein
VKKSKPGKPISFLLLERDSCRIQFGSNTRWDILTFTTV